MRHAWLAQLIRSTLIGALLFVAACSDAVEPDTSQPYTVALRDISPSDYVHETLPEDLLTRIKSITDVFEPIDGLIYEQAVDLYRRNQNPESEIIIWEEMAYAYSSFTEDKSLPIEEKHEAYKALLLASMFPESEVFNQLKPKHLTAENIDRINQLYRLEPEPVKVTEK